MVSVRVTYGKIYDKDKIYRVGDVFDVQEDQIEKLGHRVEVIQPEKLIPISVPEVIIPDEPVKEPLPEPVKEPEKEPEKEKPKGKS